MKLGEHLCSKRWSVFVLQGSGSQHPADRQVKNLHNQPLERYNLAVYKTDNRIQILRPHF